MAAQPPPLARRIELGALLRGYRERAGVDAAAVAKALGWSYVQKVGLVESGKRKLAAVEVTALADLLGLDADERAKVVELGRVARKRDPGPAFVADWAQAYIALETVADRLDLFAEELLPGLVQTEDYARALLVQGAVLSPDEVEAAVRQRAERQRRLLEPGGPHLALVLSESGLRRQVGGRAVLRAQLDHLRDLASMPNAVVQVLPFEAGAHLAQGTRFTLLHIGDPVVTFAYVEALSDAEIHDRPPHTDVYRLAFDRARRAALSPADSLERLGRLILELE
ncbi:helix-turn-helix transcriptional regulator [Actinosynnema sp. NPDC050436]|uniref:helix-turn-helix domain-containing protein n=1 Tax=Actinosynnema sp. NPDC050436 TaxID=3155659 RepID=UPI003405463E